MKTNTGRQGKDPNAATKLVSRGSEIRSLVAYVAGLVQQLESALGVPHVDSYGYSPCPANLVQELYARKEKFEQEIALSIPTLT